VRHLSPCPRLPPCRNLVGSCRAIWTPIVEQHLALVHHDTLPGLQLRVTYDGPCGCCKRRTHQTRVAPMAERKCDSCRDRFCHSVHASPISSINERKLSLFDRIYSVGDAIVSGESSGQEYRSSTCPRTSDPVGIIQISYLTAPTTSFLMSHTPLHPAALNLPFTQLCATLG
jgi:hypothetical protein